ncbi:hypothetical protein [Thermomonas alba]|uniref:hypothetical protein n=1 Tax=Thermomonas alba TaxID=2888525 RepID=UPI001F034CA8|nr:hypothetical protein [Thermomonas alba]
MLNSAKAGWRLALRAVAFQVAAALATAAAGMTLGPRAALAALAGGGTLALGSLVAAWGAFGVGVSSGGVALARLLLGTAVKWLIVVVGLYLAMAVWKLPPVPVLAGAAMAAAAFLVSMRFVAKRSTTRTNA